MPDALLTQPMAVFAYLAGALGVIFWLSDMPALKKVFEITPPVIYAYFIPTISTTIGITPAASPVYDWIGDYMLLVALMLLMVSVDLRAILRLGGLALVMMLVGTAGIVIGGPITYMVFGGLLPEDAWMGLAALSGSWIGGTANMMAIAQSVGLDASDLGPIIVVDTVVGYGWMAVLLLLSGYQARFDRAVGANVDALEETNRRLEELDTTRTPTTMADVAMIVGLGFVGAVIGLALGGRMPAVGDPTIISAFTWSVLIVVTGGLLLSFTPARQLERVGASRFGYIALYLLIAAIGAQADLKAVLDAPLYLAAGALWIGIHVALLFAAAKLLKAPLFFLATGSMANVGGAASAPVVAGVYHPAMAPVGLLMAVAGYVLGIYAALFCAWMLGVLGT